MEYLDVNGFMFTVYFILFYSILFTVALYAEVNDICLAV